MNTATSSIITSAVSFFGLLAGRLCADQNANLTGFNEASIRFIKAETAVISALPEGGTETRGTDFQTRRFFRWLTPFYSDLTPYLAKAKSVSIDKSNALRLRIYFRDELLPEGWADERMEKVQDPIQNNEAGGFRYYQRVPNTICPVTTHPTGAPVFFSVWEHRKRDVKISAINGPRLKDEILLIAHKDSGMGGESLNGEDLSNIARQYFHLPPRGMMAPKDWTPEFRIDRREGRIMSGKFGGSFAGEWRDVVNPSYNGASDGGSWGRIDSARYGVGHFYFDGFNLVLHVTPVKKGVPSTSPSAGADDIDWDAEEKREKEDAAKASRK